MNIEEVREVLIEWESLSANKENREVYETRMRQLRDLLSNLQGYHRWGRKRESKNVCEALLVRCSGKESLETNDKRL